MIKRDVNLLPVPYASQIEEGAERHKFDCGAAAGVMLLRAFYPEIAITVDQFYDLCNAGRDAYLSAGQISSALAISGVVSSWKIGLKQWDLFELLAAGRPVIALINYGVLVENGFTQRHDFSGAHFIVVVGWDTLGPYIHDPYCSGTLGEAVWVPAGVFMQAWGTCYKQNNPDYAGIVASDTLYDDGSDADDILYRIRVTASALTVRAGPGRNFQAVAFLKKGDERPVYLLQDGWGKIGSEKWVALGWTEKVE